MKKSFYVVGSVLILVVVLVIVSRNQEMNEDKEDFQILGAAGAYEKQYNQCIVGCSREDPSNAFSSSNNYMCGVYCDHVISAIAGSGTPPSKVPLTDIHSVCETECSNTAPMGATHSDIRKCVSTCYGSKRVAEYCAEMWCPYSSFPNNLCMNMCTSSFGANNNQNAWTWGRFG